MAINESSNFSDTNESTYVSGSVTVGTSEVEAKVGGSRDSLRQFVTIYNGGNATIYFGPSGITTSTGEPLEKKQKVEIAVSDIGVFMITAAGTSDVIVQEIG